MICDGERRATKGKTGEGQIVTGTGRPQRAGVVGVVGRRAWSVELRTIYDNIQSDRIKY